MATPPESTSPAPEPGTDGSSAFDGARPAPVRVASSPGVAILRWTGLVLALLLVAFGGLQVITLFFRQSQDVSTSLPSTVHKVVLDTSIGDIQIRAAEPGEATHLDRHETWSISRPEISMSVADGVLAVDTTCHSWGLVTSICHVDLDLVVDETTTVVAHSNTGDLGVRKVSGPVHVSTSTGDITVDEVTSEEVRASTSTGDITLNGITAEEVSASTSTGDITLGLAEAPTTVKARTSTGNVQILVPRDGTIYQVLSSTSVGEQTIEVPTSSNSPNLIEVSTSVGDIDIMAGPF